MAENDINFENCIITNEGELPKDQCNLLKTIPEFSELRMIYEMTSQIESQIVRKEEQKLENATADFYLISQFYVRVSTIYVSRVKNVSGSTQQLSIPMPSIQNWLQKLIQKILNLIKAVFAQIISVIQNLVKNSNVKSWHLTISSTPPNISVTFDFNVPQP